MTLQVVHAAAPVVPRDRLIDRAEVSRLAGIKSSQLYALIRANRFPAPVRLSRRCSRWSEAAVLSWIQARIVEGGAN